MIAGTAFDHILLGVVFLLAIVALFWPHDPPPANRVAWGSV